MVRLCPEEISDMDRLEDGLIGAEWRQRDRGGFPKNGLPYDLAAKHGRLTVPQKVAR